MAREDLRGDVVELGGGHAGADAAGELADASRRRRGPRRAGRPAHQGGRWTPCHPHISMSSATFTRPSRGDVLELTIDSLAHGGNGVARLEGYVVFVAGGVPGDRVKAEVGKSKKAYAEARAIEIVEPSPERIPDVADHPGAPWQVLPYERQLAVKAEQVEDALRRIGQPRRVRASSRSSRPSEQWRYRNKVEFSFGAGPEGELVCGFHAPGRWNDIVADGRLQARLRARQRAARARSWRSVASRATCRGTAATSAASCATSSSARAAAPARPRSAWSPRPASSTSTASSPRSTPTACWWTQTADLGESTYGGETTLLAGAPAARRAAQRPRLPDLARGVLPDQHRDGREALRRRAGVRRRCAATRRSSTSTAASARSRSRMATPRPPGDRPGDRRARRRRRDRERPHQRDRRTRTSTRATRAWPCASSSSARASRTSRSSTRRARASRRRSSAGSSTPRPSADRLRLLQPDDARAERRPARRGRLPPGQGAPGRHVPADPAHRVRGAAGSRPGRGQEPRPRVVTASRRRPRTDSRATRAAAR